MGALLLSASSIFICLSATSPSTCCLFTVRVGVALHSKSSCAWHSDPGMRYVKLTQLFAHDFLSCFLLSFWMNESTLYEACSELLSARLAICEAAERGPTSSCLWLGSGFLCRC